MVTPIILDCDPGHDDAVAILLAVASTAIDLKAVTTVFGNCSLNDATRNACQILTLAGATGVPVAAGADKPLKGQTVLGNYVHGVSGLDGPSMPAPQVTPQNRHAVDLMTDVLITAATPLTLVATGPITNIAHLLQGHPDLTGKIAEIIFMGGSTERGNHTPTAEFNAFADPEALDVVLNSGVPARMVGLNLTHQALATPAIVNSMRAIDHPIAQTCAAWMGFFRASYNRVWDFAAPPVHDPCTIAWLIDPFLIESEASFVSVELEGSWTRGTTVVDLHHRYPDREPNITVAINLDAAAYWDLLLDSLSYLAKHLNLSMDPL